MLNTTRRPVVLCIPSYSGCTWPNTDDRCSSFGESVWGHDVVSQIIRHQKPLPVSVESYGIQSCSGSLVRWVVIVLHERTRRFTTSRPSGSSARRKQASGVASAGIVAALFSTCASDASVRAASASMMFSRRWMN